MYLNDFFMEPIKKNDHLIYLQIDHPHQKKKKEKNEPTILLSDSEF